MQQRLHRTGRRPVHGLWDRHVQRQYKHGGMHTVSEQFEFPVYKHECHGLCVQRAIHGPERRPVRRVCGGCCQECFGQCGVRRVPSRHVLKCKCGVCLHGLSDWVQGAVWDNDVCGLLWTEQQSAEHHIMHNLKSRSTQQYNGNESAIHHDVGRGMGCSEFAVNGPERERASWRADCVSERVDAAHTRRDG